MGRLPVPFRRLVICLLHGYRQLLLLPLQHRLAPLDRLPIVRVFVNDASPDWLGFLGVVLEILILRTLSVSQASFILRADARVASAIIHLVRGTPADRGPTRPHWLRLWLIFTSTCPTLDGVLPTRFSLQLLSLRERTAILDHTEG